MQGTVIQRTLGLPAITVLGMAVTGCGLVSALVTGEGGAMPPPTDAGTCAEYSVDADDMSSLDAELLDETRAIIEERVEASGIADAVVETEADGRISVHLPGASPESESARAIRDLVPRPGVLEFVPVPVRLSGQILSGVPLPDGMADMEPFLTGDDIADSGVHEDPTTREPVVDLVLGPTGARLFDEFAAAHQGEQIAIVVDGLVQSAPTINATAFGGEIQISGNFTPDAVGHLVAILKLGSLPLGIHEVSFETCGAFEPAEAD